MQKKSIKRVFGRALLIILAAFVVLQFIRPPRNTSESSPDVIVAGVLALPQNVHEVLRRSCYDCHSNNTVYPWYAEVQPVGWWLRSHIDDGKAELNFDEFSKYRLMRQYRKLQEIAEQVEEDLMPLPSYLIIHRDARLSQEERNLLTGWAGAMRDSMRVWFPADSLQPPRRN